jgi:hypothetical protein
MYSAIVDGKVLDFHFKLLIKDQYAFYLGDIFVGQIFHINKSWDCVSYKSHELNPVCGFRTRYHAAEMLLKMNKLGLGREGRGVV